MTIYIDAERSVPTTIDIDSRNVKIVELQKENKQLKQELVLKQNQVNNLLQGKSSSDAFLSEVFGVHWEKNMDDSSTTNTATTTDDLKIMTTQELVDAFITLYDEARLCSKDRRSQNKRVTNFVEKYKDTVSHIKNKRMNPNKYDIITLLGKGSYSEVFLAKKKHDKKNKPTVLKRMSKNKVHGDGSGANGIWPDVELEVMVKANESKAPGIVKLYHAFHDPMYIYFSMEYYVGGDMLNMLDRKENFSATWACFYFAEMCLCVKSLHSLGFIHRDLKLDDFLLHRSGHLVLTDFGSACSLNEAGKCTKDIYITSEYMAPELVNILRGKSVVYGPKVDWWSMGVILFEMQTGITPFEGDDFGTVMVTDQIANFKETFKWPKEPKVNDGMKSLCQGLIEEESKRYDFKDIEKHNVYSHVDWIAAVNNLNLEYKTCEMKSGMSIPFKPEVVGPFDTAFFDNLEFNNDLEDDNQSSLRPTPSSRMANTSYDFGKLLPYVGFSYAFSSIPESDHNVINSGSGNLSSSPRLANKHHINTNTVVEDSSHINTNACGSNEISAKIEQLGVKSINNNNNNDHKKREGVAFKHQRRSSMILEKNCRIQFVDEVVFFECVRSADLENIEAMLKKGFDVNYTNDSFDQTPLHVAAIYGQLDAVKLLLYYKASVNVQDDLLCTPLHYSLVSEENEIARILLNNGADPTILDSEGSNAIDMTDCSLMKDEIKVIVSSMSNNR